jgi:hypothetical protein
MGGISILPLAIRRDIFSDSQKYIDISELKAAQAAAEKANHAKSSFHVVKSWVTNP